MPLGYFRAVRFEETGILVLKFKSSFEIQNDGEEKEERISRSNKTTHLQKQRYLQKAWFDEAFFSRKLSAISY
jgi:hypothetical protein